MRKKLSTLLILILILCGMLYLRSHKKAEDIPNSETQEQTIAASNAVSAQDITLGTVTANETDGGITITVPQEDGTEKTYIFTDVEKDEWYTDAVNYVVSTGLMNGSEDGFIFLPNYGIQRLEYAIVISRFAGAELNAKKCSFPDMTGQEWFAKYVDWIVAEGYMGGLSDGTFAPFGYLTVEQAIVVLYRYSGEPYVDGSLVDYPYTPKISESAVDAMTWAWNKGLITEEECVWYPTQAISRAQVALLLTRCSKVLEPAA